MEIENHAKSSVEEEGEALSHSKRFTAQKRDHTDCIIIILAYQALRGRVLGYWLFGDIKEKFHLIFLLL
jgi:hypothetical protein